jgi:hypothetical protein
MRDILKELNDRNPGDVRVSMTGGFTVLKRCVRCGPKSPRPNARGAKHCRGHKFLRLHGKQLEDQLKHEVTRVLCAHVARFVKIAPSTFGKGKGRVTG